MRSTKSCRHRFPAPTTSWCRTMDRSFVAAPARLVYDCPRNSEQGKRGSNHWVVFQLRNFHCRLSYFFFVSFECNLRKVMPICKQVFVAVFTRHSRGSTKIDYANIYFFYSISCQSHIWIFFSFQFVLLTLLWLTRFSISNVCGWKLIILLSEGRWRRCLW